MALNIVRHVIVEEQLPVLFVSLEQTRIELAERLLAAQARVDSHKLRKGHLSGEDIGKLHGAGDVLAMRNSSSTIRRRKACCASWRTLGN